MKRLLDSENREDSDDDKEKKKREHKTELPSFLDHKYIHWFPNFMAGGDMQQMEEALNILQTRGGEEYRQFMLGVARYEIATQFGGGAYGPVRGTGQALRGLGRNAAKASTSLGAGRTGVKQWLQNAGNLERGQLIKDIEGAGFQKVFDGKGMMHFERGGMKIRLDPPQPGTPLNHMHLNYGGNKSAYDIFLNPVKYKSPAAHIPIR